MGKKTNLFCCENQSDDSTALIRDLKKFRRELQTVASQPLSRNERSRYLKRHKDLVRDINTTQHRTRFKARDRQRIQSNLQIIERIIKNLKSSPRGNTESSEIQAAFPNDTNSSCSSQSQLMADTTRKEIQGGNKDVEMGQPEPYKNSDEDEFNAYQVGQSDEKMNQQYLTSSIREEHIVQSASSLPLQSRLSIETEGKDKHRKTEQKTAAKLILPTPSSSSQSQLMADTSRQKMEGGNEDVVMGQQASEEPYRKSDESEVNACQVGPSDMKMNQQYPTSSIGEEHLVQSASSLPLQLQWSLENESRDKHRKTEQKTAVEWTLRSVPSKEPKSMEKSYGEVSQLREDMNNFNLSDSNQHEKASIFEPQNKNERIDEPTGSMEQQSNHEGNFEEENQSHGVGSHWEAPLHIPPEPEEKPLEILDVGQYFRDDFDLSSLNGLEIADQISRIDDYSKTFENKVQDFNEEKYSIPYFVLDEKLMRLIEKLDKIRCPDNELTTRKIEVIQYIKNLHNILDQRAKDV